MNQKIASPTLPKLQETLFQNPHQHIQKIITQIYKKNEIIVGWQKNEPYIFEPLSRKNTAAIVGVMLGDEGKGRFIDNKIADLLGRKGIKKVAVIRFQGGNNAGHTIEYKGKKLDLHLLPSSVLYKKTIGIMDRGELINMEDLQTEVEYVEKIVGSLKNRLFVSQDSILNTDLDRAEESLNREKTGKAKGGTSRGIGPSYAHYYDRLGLKISDLLQNDWEEIIINQYKRYEKEFKSFGKTLYKEQVPDFHASHKVKKAITRTVGTVDEFINRIKKARTWILKRKMITNTFPLHQKIANDSSIGILFEGAQAAGLDAWLGTLPDMTASNTSVYGVREGTGFWRVQDIEEKIGVFKIPYTSSVGARRMPTHVDLPKDLNDLKNPTAEQELGAWIREAAHEYGTTTGRPRDINFLDLAFLRYNARMCGIEMLAGTHLDIARPTDSIKVCTHYTDSKGNYVPYQPGLSYQEQVKPHYVDLPGWEGEKCQKAKSKKELPENALKFLSFIQAATGFPIVAVTTGYKREHLITL